MEKCKIKNKETKKKKKIGDFDLIIEKAYRTAKLSA